MSLVDLKKSKKSRSKKKTFTVDEFIADADNYAKGEPKIVCSEIEPQISRPSTLAISQNKLVQDTSENKTFRRATFTLNEQAIEQLQLLAGETKLAKSRILRILIDEICKKSHEEKLKKLLSSQID
jgi:hypothetical protein